ncbi:MAG: hypothetical protein AAGB34_03735 [Planctomycetota bacterium]
MPSLVDLAIEASKPNDPLSGFGDDLIQNIDMDHWRELLVIEPPEQEEYGSNMFVEDVLKPVGQALVKIPLESISGVMKVAERHGLDPVKNIFWWEDGTADQVQDVQKTALDSSVLKQVNPDPGPIRRVVRGVSGAVPQIASSITAAMLTGGGSAVAQVAAFAASQAPQQFGATFYESKEELIARGYSEKEAEDIAMKEATTVATASTVINTVPGGAFFAKSPIGSKALSAAISKIVKQQSSKYIMSGLAEGSTEVLEAIAQETARQYIRESKDTFSGDFWRSLPEQAIVGTIVGAGGRAVVDRISDSGQVESVNLRDWAAKNPDAAVELATMDSSPSRKWFRDHNLPSVTSKQREGAASAIRDVMARVKLASETETSLEEMFGGEQQTVVEPSVPPGPETTATPIPAPASEPDIRAEPDIEVLPDRGAAQIGKVSRKDEAKYSERLLKQQTVELAERYGFENRPDLEYTDELGDVVPVETLTTFAGKVPSEIRKALEGEPLALRLLKGNVPGALGEDVMSSMGADDMVGRIRDSLRSSYDRAAEHLTQVQGDPEIGLNELLLRKQAERPSYIGDNLTGEIENPAGLEPGTTLSIFGEEFQVVDEGGIRYLQSTVEPTVDSEGFERAGDVVQLDGVATLPVDEGSVKEPARSLLEQVELAGERANLRMERRAREGVVLRSGISARDITNSKDAAIWVAGEVAKGVRKTSDLVAGLRQRWAAKDAQIEEAVRRGIKDGEQSVADYVILAAGEHLKKSMQPDRLATLLRRAHPELEGFGELSLDIAEKGIALANSYRNAGLDKPTKRFVRIKERAAHKAGKQAAFDESRITIERLKNQVKDKIALREAHQETRREVVKLLRSILPVKERGEYANQIASAKTNNDYVNVAIRAHRHAAILYGRSLVAKVDRLANTGKKSGRSRKGAGFKKLHAENRKKARELHTDLDRYRDLLKHRVKSKDSPVGDDELVGGVRKIEEIHAEIAGIFAEEKMLYRSRQELRGQSLHEAIGTFKGEVESRRVAPKWREGLDKNRQERVSKLWRLNMTLETAASAASNDYTGKSTGVRVLYENMRDADNAHLDEINRLRQKAEKALGEAGITGGFSRVKREASGAAGETNQRTISTSLGGQQVNLTFGEAAKLIASDSETRSWFESGGKIVLDRKNTGEQYNVSREDLAALERTLPPEYVRAVLQLKYLRNTELSPKVQETQLRLDGTAPDYLPDYEPRRRDLSGQQQSVDAAIRGEGQAQTVESKGFLKDRDHNVNAPVIIGDFFTDWDYQVEQMAQYVHLAEPTKMAVRVLQNPGVKGSLVDRFGEGMFKRLESLVVAASGQNQRIDSGSGRFFHGLLGNVAAAVLPLNPGTITRQLGGTFRLAAEIGDATAWSAGLASVGQYKLRKLAAESGWVWDRYYRGDTYARFTQNERAAMQAVDVDNTGSLEIVQDFVKALTKGDLGGIHKTAKAMGEKSGVFLTHMDAVNLKVAMGAYMHIAKKQHPDWGESKARSWALENAVTAMRRTQNSSRAIDQSSYAVNEKGKPGSLFNFMMSDPVNAANRLFRAYHRGKGPFAAHAFAEMANAAWSLSVGRAATPALVAAGVYAAVQLGLAEEDEAEKLYSEMIEEWSDPDRIGLQTIRELAGLLGPLQGPGAYVAVEGAKMFDLFDPPRYYRGEIISPAGIDNLNRISSLFSSKKTTPEKIVDGGIEISMFIPGIQSLYVPLKRMRGTQKDIDEIREERVKALTR